MTCRLASDQRGVIGIQVGLALVVLLGFCAFSIDYGVLWVARAQAQNAADAGALAAATALAFDSMATGEGTPVAQGSAIAVASSVTVWGRPSVIELPWVCNTVSSTPSALSCPTVPGLPPVPPRTFFGATVRVYADEAHLNALPTYFAGLFGVSSQEIRAQATAAVAPANTATCVWPLAIPDFWTENTNPADSAFSAYLYPPGPPAPALPPDDYRAPPTYLDGVRISGADNPSGIVLTTNATPSNSLLIPRMTMSRLLSAGETPVCGPSAAYDCIDKSTFVALRVPRSDGGTFAANLASCNQSPVHIGDVLELETGARWDQVTAGAADRKSQDLGASWVESKYRIRGSNAAISPRLVLLPVFDPERYDATRGTVPEIHIVNFVGFFIDTVTEQITGNLTTYPGTAEFGHPFVRLQYAPLRTAVLTR